MGKKQRRRRHRRKDISKPKRALSAYFFYLLERRESLKRQQPNLDHKELIKTMGLEWNEMSEEKKKPYQEKSNEDHIRFDREKAEYEQRKKEIYGDNNKKDKEIENFSD